MEGTDQERGQEGLGYPRESQEKAREAGSAEEENRRHDPAALEDLSPTRPTLANKDIIPANEYRKRGRVTVCGRMHSLRAQEYTTLITLACERLWLPAVRT